MALRARRFLQNLPPTVIKSTNIREKIQTKIFSTQEDHSFLKNLSNQSFPLPHKKSLQRLPIQLSTSWNTSTCKVFDKIKLRTKVEIRACTRSFNGHLIASKLYNLHIGWKWESTWLYLSFQNVESKHHRCRSGLVDFVGEGNQWQGENYKCGFWHDEK